jgi:hypothetical protein
MLLHASWLGPERTLQQVQRLHIIHNDHLREPTYQDLITRNCWENLSGRESLDTYALLKENAQLADIAKHLAKVCPHDPIMPRLERVVMGGIRESIWTDYPLGYSLRCYDRKLANALIDLPTVRHYCQSFQVGPLSLPSGLLAVKSPLETFTYHAVPGHGPSPHPGGMPPVILGAVNRYYFSCNHTLVSMDGVNFNVSAQELYGILIMIIQMFQPTYMKPRKTVSGKHISTKDIRNTTIELYDFIRHVRIHPPEVKLAFPHTNGKAMGLADRPAESLEHLQDTLDSYVDEEWRGRVVLKNREEASPCQACDLDSREQWKIQGLPEGENPSSVYLSEGVIGDLLQVVP